ncbi:MarR family transcriptional regulator [Bacillus altitudinis]|uniref:MarR family winged helix-turn-helix transcriptional regulator n=1 Tax=Bacillus altitudinis TaxID=293387 RepID=UPI0002DB6B7A|nr:MarR family transcriptional regulator [Bacillus altitudinis]QKL20630.1 MarR family transcriptional regulator [Bacillus altitudinis]QKL24360.1 MarR family transcriptional regulator [Bacillus altitudinis]QXY94755.1 MarR family transcriptional regulator [Bacillus altitudinis]
MVQQEQELDLRLFRVWMKAYHALFANIQKDIERYDIGFENFQILELLYSKGPHPVQKISEILSIPSGSITYVVNKLEKQELVKRQCALSDKRVFHVLLTDKGKQLFDDIFPKHTDVISQNLSFIETEEKEQLIEWLKKIGLGAKQLHEKGKQDDTQL